MHSRTDIATGEDMGGSSKWSRNMEAYEAGGAQYESMKARQAAEASAASAASSAAAAQKSNKQPQQESKPSGEGKPSGGGMDLKQIMGLASMFGGKK